MNYYSDTPEWSYLVKNFMDWDTIIPLYYPSFPTPDGFNNKEELIAFFEEMLTNTGKWAGTSLRDRALELDKVGAGTLKDDVFTASEPLKKSYQEAKELGFLTLAAPREFGGMAVPVSLLVLIEGQIMRACQSTAIQLGFFVSIADMLDRFCSKELSERLVPRILEGELSGSMCLTEPGAGSDVGSLKTRAEKQPDGTYKLNGTKIFISNGGGGLGFVLARIKGAPEGLKGISLFLAEEWIDGRHNYRVTKMEEKMGLHGSATCEIVYEDSVAHLVGGENEGFQQMLHLMNEARLLVGVQGLAGIEGALDRAKEYAQVREQFGKPLMEHALYRRNFTDWETERDALRVLMADAIVSFDVYQKLDHKKRHTGDLTEDEAKLFKKHSRKIRHLTPLVKFYGSESFARLTIKAIQAFGGYGYMQEYQVERYHRDSFGALLYEGTSQIQSLMAMKDFLKFTFRDPSKFFQKLVATHPIGTLFSEGNPYERAFRSMTYDFNKGLAGLLFKVIIRPDGGPDNKDVVPELKRWVASKPSFKLDEKKVDKLIVHAETFCEGLSYIETLRAVKKLAVKDPTQAALFERYRKLVAPRLEAIYKDWSQA